ncbi:MAG: ABC transporter substrate-binding protein [Actinomycetota bacterium]|nr:ABC transporter substrate-binding protein [Actinomycetota bacterium]
MDRVRLMGWCSTCVPGLQLPAFAAIEGGLFAEHGLEVEFVGCASAPDYSLRGFTVRPKAVAAGDADFALSGVAYLLAAQTDAHGRLPVRFAAISHQRNPISAVVHAASDFTDPEDLQGARAARWNMPWFTAEYAGAMAYMGLEPPVTVDRSKDLDLALGRGEIDVIPTWMDMTLHHHTAGSPIRVIPLDIDVYTTGLIAADRLPLELVARMRDAFVAGYQLQQEQPELGIAAFRRSFPHVSEDHVRANWALFEPNAFDGGRPGSMDADRWRRTIEYTAATHGLSVFAGDRLYRPELVDRRRRTQPRRAAVAASARRVRGPSNPAHDAGALPGSPAGGAIRSLRGG